MVCCSRFRWSSFLCLGLCLIGLAACTSKGASSGVSRADSAGIEIATSRGADRPLNWQFHREFALGGAEEGPESFYNVSSRNVRADANGNLFIMDASNHRVVVFDAEGRFIRSMGREGGGPGEFGMAGTMSVTPEGKLAVFDLRKGNLVRFNESGGVEVERPFPIFPIPNQQRHFQQFGDTVFALTSSSMSEADGRRQVLLQIVGEDTLVIAEVPEPPSEMAVYMECGGGLRQPPLFVPDLTWSAQPGTLVVGKSTEYSISVVQAGQVTRIVRRDITPMPASRDQAIEHLGEGLRMNFGQGPCTIDPTEMVDNRGHAETIPLIQHVLLSPSGEIWVQRFASPRGSVGQIDVFDADWAYVGTIDTESFEPLILLPDNRVGIVEKDEDDIERIVILSILKGES